MGTRAKIKFKTKAIRFRGVTFEDFDSSCLIKVGLNSKSWPQIAMKLDVAGLSPEISQGKTQTFIRVNALADVCRDIIAGHKMGRKTKPIWFLIGAIPIVVIAGTILLGHKVSPATTKITHEIDSSCSEEMIIGWLEGRTNSGEVKLLETSVLGGITAGSIQCKDSRYKYTLGSKEPKRVLNLELLDS